MSVVRLAGIAALCVSLSTSCRGVSTPEGPTLGDHPPSYLTEEKLTLSLRVEKELNDAVVEMQPVMIVEIQKELDQHIDALLGATIAETTLDGRDGVLTVTFIAGARSVPMWAWSEATTVIIVQWSLRTNSGSVLWVDTVEGTASGPAGAGSGTAHARAQIAQAIEDLCRKSQRALLSSPELAVR